MPLNNILSDFLSHENFELAWERVLRSQHAENKDRIAFRVFSSNIDHNLARIIQEIQADIYSPSIAPKIYLPKVSRTLRTIPVLSISDRIVYQAIGNLIVREASPDLSFVFNRHVFAHLPQKDESLFAVMPWRMQINKFINNYERIWKQGNRWVVEADISAFYASIEHGLLIDLIRNRWISDEKFLSLLHECLRTWSPHERGPELGRGIPQGYETSDLFATFFLLPVDESLVRNNRYLRYVDDIRILSKDRDSASKALVKLDLELKSLGLILQTKKLGLEEVKSLEDEKDTLRKKLSQISILINSGKNPQDELTELFFEAWHLFESSPEDADRALAFSLYRLEPNSTIQKFATKLLEILPWRSAVINKYLENFNSDTQVINDLLEILRNHKVYAWHLANCMRTLAKISTPDSYRELALEWIQNTNLQWFQRLAAVEALQYDQDSHAALHSAIHEETNILIKRSLIVACAFQAYTSEALEEVALLIRRAFEDEDREIKLLAVWLRQQFPEISWDDINFSGDLGILQPLIPELASQPSETPCFIKHKLRSFYDANIHELLDFSTIFSDYTGTILDLKKAIPYYYTDPSLYIGLINSFNHRIAISLKQVINSSIPDDQFGNMMESNEFTSQVPQIALYFGKCNEIRNRTTGFHPFASALGSWSQLVSHSEKENIHQGLKLSYQEFVDIYEAYLGIT